MSEIDSLPERILETMHNEHCSYKSTRKLLAELPTEGEYVIQGPGENAGVVRLGQGEALALRIESHNHPSAIEPFDGAATGVGGIIRDIFTMGARPIALLDMLRFGTNEKSSQLLEGVVEGISYYGNCVGIPVVGGDTYFDRTYNGNPLVNVCCMGLVKEENIIFGNALTPGNDLWYAGARTGRDGIDGSKLASGVLSGKEGKGAIQKGDPYLEKLLIEAQLELIPFGCLEGSQDMGAAGNLCSTTEVAYRGLKRSGLPIGSRIFANKIPTKENNMTVTELLLSESQERMLLVGKRAFRESISSVFNKWDLEAVIIGDVTEDGNYTIVFDEDGQLKTLIMSIEEICGDVYQEWPRERWKTQGGSHTKASQAVTESIWRRYDWRVGTRTIKGPNEPGHFAILDLEEIGKELVVSWSSDEGRSDESPIDGIYYAFDKAYGKLKNLEAIPLGLTNCMNFGNPPDSMGAFAETIEGLSKKCREFEVPVISGNVSLYNASKIDGKEISIKPTPILVMVGIR